MKTTLKPILTSILLVIILSGCCNCPGIGDDPTPWEGKWFPADGSSGGFTIRKLGKGYEYDVGQRDGPSAAVDENGVLNVGGYKYNYDPETDEIVYKGKRFKRRK